MDVSHLSVTPSLAIAEVREPDGAPDSLDHLVELIQSWSLSAELYGRLTHDAATVEERQASVYVLAATRGVMSQALQLMADMRAAGFGVRAALREHADGVANEQQRAKLRALSVEDDQA